MVSEVVCEGRYRRGARCSAWSHRRTSQRVADESAQKRMIHGGLPVARATTSHFAGVSAVAESKPLADDLPGQVQDRGVVM
jgi:hypothetical protein